MIKKCCVCSRIKTEGKWQRTTSTCTEGKITHVYCPTCFAKTMARIRRYATCRTKKVQNTDLAGVLYGT